VQRGRSILWGCGLAAAAFAAGLALLLSSSCSATDAKVRGAAALAEEPAPQETAATIRPDPAHAAADRGPIVSDGCMVGVEGTRSAPCAYGVRRGHASLILYGDSHAAQYFVPLQQLAKRNHWRLYVLNKRECPPFLVAIRGKSGGRYASCLRWQHEELRRIGKGGRRTTVVMSGDTGYTAYGPHGQRLHGAADGRALEHGYLETLRRIRREGLGAVVIRDLPPAPRYVPACVEENRDHLRRCAFRRVRRGAREFDVRAARAVPGVELIDLVPEVCPHGLCRAVIGNALTYRDTQHLTATFARTLSPWIAAGLREAGVPFRRHPH
jgi:SGNH domain (fused to AT3 domains)